jgi:hypothetical protein
MLAQGGTINEDTAVFSLILSLFLPLLLLLLLLLPPSEIICIKLFEGICF